MVNFNVKSESKDFPMIVGNGKYLSLISSSKINAIENDCIPELKFNFIDTDDIQNLEANSKCG